MIINLITKKSKKLKIIYSSLIRPANTIAYNANDAITNSTTSPSIITLNIEGELGGSGYIVNAMCTTNINNFNSSLRLHLYKLVSSSDIIIPNDNNTFNLIIENSSKNLGTIEFNTFFSSSSSSTCSISYGNFPQSRGYLPYFCETNNNNIYALLETKSNFTPLSGQVFDFQISIEQN